MSRKNSLLYILKKEKPSLIQWYILRFTGSIKKGSSGYFYSKPYWVWKIHYNKKPFQATKTWNYDEQDNKKTRI